MQGRLAGIKKSYLIRISAILLLFVFIVSVLLDIYLLNVAELWFFSFCLCIGLFELVESFLFHFDSAFYFGSLLSLIGSSGYIFTFPEISKFAVFFVALSFLIASLLTSIVYKQKFHLIISFSILFPTTYGFLFAKNLITLPIFIAFSCCFLVILILSLTTSLKWRV